MGSFAEKALLRACPVCGFGSGEVLCTLRAIIPRGYNLQGSCDIVCCKNCAFCYADVKAAQKDYDNFYAKHSKYTDKKISSGGNLTSWGREYLKKTACNISEALEDRKAAILDIGCANGGLLAELKEAGYHNLTGVDPSPDCVLNVRAQGFKAHTGSIFSKGLSDLANEEFDCVVLSHVLEHIYDLKGAVSIVIGKLRAGGLLYVEAPDASRYADFYKVPYYYFDYEHINHFDENSLANLFLRFSLKPRVSAKREITASSNDLYPAVYAVYEKTNSPVYGKGVVRSLAVRDNIIKYIKLSQQDNILNQLNQLAESGEPIAVWGAGSYTVRLLSDSALSNCNIAYFVDNDRNKQGMILNSLRVYPPEKLKSHRGPIVVSSALFSNDILDDIKKMGLNNKVLVLRKSASSQ